MAIPKVTASQALATGADSRLYIAAVGTAADATVWSETMRVPLTQELAFTPTGSIQSISLFGERFDHAVKAGVGGTLSATVLATSTNPLVKTLLDAAHGTGDTARVRFLVVNPDKHAYVGVLVVEAAPGKYDNRNVFGYTVNGMVDGEFVPFELANGDITAA